MWKEGTNTDAFLCYIFTPDKKMLNIQMVKDGYAVLLTIPPNIKYVDELRMAENEARQHRQGIWNSRGLKESPRRLQKKALPIKINTVRGGNA